MLEGAKGDDKSEGHGAGLEIKDNTASVYMRNEQDYSGLDCTCFSMQRHTRQEQPHKPRGRTLMAQSQPAEED